MFFALSGTAVATHGGAPFVDSADIVDGQVKTADIGGNEILSSDIADGRIFNVDVGNNVFTTEKIKDETLTGADVKEDSLSGGDVFEPGLSGFNRAELGPRAFARIDSSGDVIEADSVGVDDVMVSVTPNRLYCFNLPFDVRHVQVTAAVIGFDLVPQAHPEASLCGGSNDATVALLDVSSGSFVHASFMVAFD